MIAAYMCTGVRGEGHMYFEVLVPLVFYTVVLTAASVSFWWWGPAVAHHRLYQPALAAATFCVMPMLYVGYLGPEVTVPWHNNLQWLVVCCMSIFFGLQHTSAGVMPGEHPAEPRTSIREPFLRSALQALMLLDALSDLAVTRSLLRAVCSH